MIYILILMAFLAAIMVVYTLTKLIAWSSGATAKMSDSAFTSVAKELRSKDAKAEKDVKRF